MSHNPMEQGPAKGALSTIQRIFSLLIGMAETRLQLLAVELEEEKVNLLKLLLIAGFSLLFAAFGLTGLFILLSLAIDPAHRIMALSIVTGILLFLSITLTIVAIHKAKRMTFLPETRNQLKIDRSQLSEKR